MFEFLEYITENEDNYKYLSQGTILGLILFILYLELSPKLGNVWYRYTSNGNRELQPKSLLHFLCYPFRDTLFWRPENWDLNFIVVSGFTGILWTSIEKCLRFS